MEISIDGNSIANEAEFHKILKQELELPHYYGENLDALWDCLTGWVDLPLKVIWLNYKIDQKKLGDFSVRIESFFNDVCININEFEIEYR
ncbi:barnase inhibitor [Mucilaginibacter limnophilus]|uniref:Barnase inhibitor n=1 Tax=Mucilaginibacter limnophilus TaxID=1932778 RepID=A0A3S2UNM1_9SPHI|nr:barstar family protein [Mucilaginibacter limnophilus]RVU00561.1 barnase inhibitor [Mucilaginibacter limnophilus]